MADHEPPASRYWTYTITVPVPDDEAPLPTERVKQRIAPLFHALEGEVGVTVKPTPTV